MRDLATSGLPFVKMHGLGNDFVILDARKGAVTVTPALARAIGDRHRGVGFDQLAMVEAGTDSDLKLTFWNADGSLAGACGNATRCIAGAEMERTGETRLTLRTERGLLVAEDAGEGLTRVNMGAPLTGWRDIPLAEAADTDRLPLAGEPVATSMGNPHCTFFVPDAGAADLAAFGRFETHPLFPERTNVQAASLTAPDTLRVRVWERGVGPTLASGSSACAVAVAAVRRGLTGRRVAIDLDGGRLTVEWRDDGVWMTGPTATVFEGTLSPAWLETV